MLTTRPSGWEAAGGPALDGFGCGGAEGVAVEDVHG